MAIFARLVSPAGALRLLSLAMGVFLIFMGLDKIDWLMDAGFLTRRLQEWRGMARPIARWYLDTLALPGAPVFARVVPLAELAAGVGLMLGMRVRLAAALALLMVVNFHVAADVIFRYSYLSNGYGPPVLGALLALSVGGARLPFSASR
ncbi:MAG: DoxX family membrane protein [Acidobacteria bacterium]|nr:DoxX family membrane protein [Acidobacteriota bacterium]